MPKYYLNSDLWKLRRILLEAGYNKKEIREFERADKWEGWWHDAALILWSILH